eukprot:MONOS_2626.1-p1 / transcript=MONOS_2626.1 / gene=MONOS_2626 / organism=Monocercomonoides_exilis_PA203 / gene_product=unspecified product / transcript_product=unspecified product / location=Mono_scaffold00055:88926-89638(+) / protein_length=192 / sequence_SO=supercontig / SO=protein_coding / is_pseudo=false
MIMYAYAYNKLVYGFQEISATEKFLKYLNELVYCDEEGQKQEILEMNEIIDGMNNKEFNAAFTKGLFNKVHRMIEEKKISMTIAVELLKHIGYCKVLKRIWFRGFEESSLNQRFKQMIIEEDKKKEERNEKLLTDLCECHLLLNRRASSELFSIYVPYLLKVAMNKEESEENQKEVEMALLALSNVDRFCV